MVRENQLPAQEVKGQTFSSWLLSINEPALTNQTVSIEFLPGKKKKEKEKKNESNVISS